jgi:uncharacterized protein YwqG
MMTSPERLLTLARSGASIAEQTAALLDELRGCGLDDASLEEIVRSLEPGYFLEEVEGPTRSRIGGGASVRLPTGRSWPTSDGQPLSFLYEIVFDDLTGLDEVGMLPTGGALLVFHQENDAYTGQRLNETSVMWRPHDDPGVETDEGLNLKLGQWQPLGQRWLAGYATPFVTVTDRDYAITEIVLDARSHLFNKPRLCAGAQTVDSLPETITKWFMVAANHGRHEEIAAFDAAEQRGEGWRLLLQQADHYYPDEGLGLQWSVAGTRLIVIPEIDLAQKRFDRCFTIYDR